MSFRSVGFKKPDGTLTGAIPEVNGLGLIKVKTASGVENATALHINDGTPNPKLIWEPYTATQPEPTQPVGPCDNNPVCLNGSFVHYPLSPATGTPRWDCAVWASTAQTVGMSPPVQIQDPDWNSGDPIEGRWCANVYSFTSGITRPPPPTYIVAEYTTYTIADNFTFFIKNNYVSSAASLNQQNFPLFPADQITTASNPPKFDEKHGASSATYYYLNKSCMDGFFNTSCPCDPTACNPPLPPPIDPVSTPLCDCAGGACFETGIQITQQGTECLSAAEYITNSDVFPLLSIGCIATSYCNAQYSTGYGCAYGSCYGKPTQPSQSDSSPSAGYEHRLVSKMPQNLYNYTDGSTEFRTIPNFYNALPTFNELALLSDNGCDPQQCGSTTLGCGPNGCDNPSGRCPSAYLTKIFLPFYVNVPSVFDAATGQTIDLRGKYVEFTKTNLQIDGGGFGGGGGAPSNVYDNFPLLKQMRHIIEGKKRACGVVLGIEHDSTDGTLPIKSSIDPNTGNTLTNLNYAAFEFPKINTAAGGLSTQTHQLVLEIRNGSANFCSSCINTGEKSSGSENISYLRLYPITNTAGQIVQASPIAPYRQWFTNHINNSNNLGVGGLNSVISYKYEGNGVGAFIRETNTTSVSIGNATTETLGIYQDVYNLTTGVVSPITNPNNPNNLTYELLMNTLNQQQIPTNVGSGSGTDCLCNIV